MNNNKIKSERLGNLGTITSGTKNIYLEQKNEETGDIKVKLINWSNLKNWKKKQEFTYIKEYSINTQELYKREGSILKEGDLIFSNLPSSTEENIIYIDKPLNENYICSDNMFIFRNRSKYSSMYIYMILNSGLYNKYIEFLKVNYSHKLRIPMLITLEIPILDEATALVEKYYKMQKTKKEIEQQEQEFNDKLYDLAKRTLNI